MTTAMIIPQTTDLLKRAAEITGMSATEILRTKRDRRINAARAAIWEILIQLGHARHRIAQAFGCDAASVRWAVDHPTGESRYIAHRLRTPDSENIFSGYHDCGSGIAYGICSKCGKGHGWIIRITAPLP